MSSLNGIWRLITSDSGEQLSMSTLRTVRHAGSSPATKWVVGDDLHAQRGRPGRHLSGDGAKSDKSYGLSHQLVPECMPWRGHSPATIDDDIP